jgi:hypothetical protein
MIGQYLPCIFILIHIVLFCEIVLPLVRQEWDTLPQMEAGFRHDWDRCLLGGSYHILVILFTSTNVDINHYYILKEMCRWFEQSREAYLS